MENKDLILKSIIVGLFLVNSFINNNITIQGIIYIILAGVIAYLYYGYNEPKDDNNIYREIVRKLKRHETRFDPRYQSYLYKNPALLTIFSKFLPYCKFDTKNYKDALVAGNQLVILYESAKIGHQFPIQTISLAEQLQRNIMNNCQALILSFPTTVVSNYNFEANLVILQQVLQKIIDDIKLIYEDKYVQNGPDIYSPPPDVDSGPWKNPLNERDYDQNWNFYY